MKKLITLLLITFATTTFSQVLENTEWDLYLFGELNANVRFGPDTLFFLIDGEDEFAISTYSESSDTFYITDLENTVGGCFDDYGQVTGTYSFQISNDSLTFSVISDSCEIRTETLDFAIFIKKGPTSVTDPLSFDNISLYPNPLLDGMLYIKSDIIFDQIVVYDTFGRLLTSSSNTSKIDLSSFPNDMFVISLRKDDKILSRKIINQ